MVVADPYGELTRLIISRGDPPADSFSASDIRTAQLLRRRFGLSLPAPLADDIDTNEPVRVATPHDAGAIALTKWRCFGVNYRGGGLSDEFLDNRELVPPVSFWTGRALVPPSPNHRLLVWGRPGQVLGYADLGPVHDEDKDPELVDAGEVYELYIDPMAQGLGGGSKLLDGASEWFASRGLGRMELWVLATNPKAQGFYRSRGWTDTGRCQHVDLEVVAFDEVRFSLQI